MKPKKAGQYFPRVRLYAGEDDDIISWLSCQPFGKKGDRIKQALRVAMNDPLRSSSSSSSSSTVTSVELDTRGLLVDIRQVVSAALTEHALGIVGQVTTSELPAQEKQEDVGEGIMSSFDDEFSFDDDDDDDDDDDFTGDFV